ncbi:uncharacterized protein B0H64DRAFT_448917 [Chaetomium fimeti]|uniref:Uncharacterized protein n=1 Tax=Chaetomium fimeti TaxID=1854472 RepID=A0AAE0LWX7_9PEZI|nr:hypothetical protein B0H64DRAFT_448917 [Chaetomium fimeti]
MTHTFDTKHVLRAIPLVCSFMAFILVMLALFAGNKPGVLEGHEIITVDASHLGTNLGNKVKANALPAPQPNVGERSGVQVRSGIDDDITKGVGGNAHTGTFYSLYALTICEGRLTADNGRKLTQCYAYFSSSDQIATIPALLSARDDDDDDDDDGTTARSRSNSQTLTAVGLTYKLEAALCGLDTLVRAVGVLLAIGAGFTGLSFFANLPAMAISSEEYTHAETAYDWAVWTNLTFASGAALFLMLGSFVSCIGARTAAIKIGEIGVEAGVTAMAGESWTGLSLGTAMLMCVVLVYWTSRGVSLRKREKRGERRTKRRDVEERGRRSEPPRTPPKMDYDDHSQREDSSPSPKSRDRSRDKRRTYVPTGAKK